jgi:hypothetical protein
MLKKNIVKYSENILIGICFHSHLFRKNARGIFPTQYLQE